MIYDGDSWTWIRGSDADARTSAMERARSPSILLGQPQNDFPEGETFELPVRKYTDESLSDKSTLKRADTLSTEDERVPYDPSPVTQDSSRSNWPEDHLQRVVRAREIAHKLAKRAKKQGIQGALAEASSLVQNNLGANSFGINGVPPSILGGSVGPWGPSSSDTASTISGSTSGRSRLKAKKEIKKLARSQTQPIPENYSTSHQQSYPPQPSYAMQQWYQSQEFPPPPPPSQPPMPQIPQIPQVPQIPQIPQVPQIPQSPQIPQVAQSQISPTPVPEGEPPPYQELNTHHSF